MFRPEHHKIISLGLSICFVIALQKFIDPIPVFRYLIPAYIVYLAIVALYNVFYLRSIEKFSLWLWLRPLLFLSAWAGLFFILPGELVRGVFLMISIPVIYFVESMVGNSGERLLFNELVLTALSFFMVVAALSQYFLITDTVYLAVTFLFITLLVRASYEFSPLSFGHKWMSALVIGMFSAELLWAFSFLPFHFSAVAVLLFNIFYFCWALYYYFIFNYLTLRKIQFHVGVLVLLSLVTIMVTPWKIIT